MSSNPICSGNSYRLHVLSVLTQITRLDDVDLKQTEKEAATRYAQLKKEMEKWSSSPQHLREVNYYFKNNIFKQCDFTFPVVELCLNNKLMASLLSNIFFHCTHIFKSHVQY